MNSAIHNALQQYIDSFMETVSERFDINRNDLDKLWSETQKKKFTPSRRARRRKASVPTAYILFCKDERPKLVGMSFAEAAKELGVRWKEAADSVKERYKQQHNALLAQKDVAPSTASDDEDSATTTTEVEVAAAEMAATTTTDDEKEKKTKRKPKKAAALEIPEDITDERERGLWPEFAALTISELRTQCDHNNIKKSKNRNDMIHSLIAHRIALEDGNVQLDSDDEAY